MKCSECRGIGEVEFEEVRQFGRYQMQWVPCSACSGTGRDSAYAERLQAALDALMVEQLAEMEEEVAALAASSTIVVEGTPVHAPGFTSDQFTTFVDRAKAAQLRTSPARTPGTVMVSSGSSPASYAVTRSTCSCTAGQTHGHCYHRALAIHLHDVENVPICAVSTVGVDQVGHPVQLREVA